MTLQTLILDTLSETLVPDFVLGFTFFTALAYAVLGKRFSRQRPAAAMSAALGLALAVGLVWWEQGHDWSIRDLGPIALGIAIIVLFVAVYLAMRQLSGSLTGAAIAVVAAIIVAGMLGVDSPVAADAVLAVLILALIVGAVGLALRHQRVITRRYWVIRPPKAEIRSAIEDIDDLNKERRVSKTLWRRFRTLRREAEHLDAQPEARADLLLQIQRMLPAEGWLTERMARLREKAYHIRVGHVARLEETVHAYRDLPPSARKRAAAELAGRYQQLIGIDQRLERLDRAVAETERRIRALTQEAQGVVARYEFQRVDGLLKDAEKLQDHNTRLCRLISRTEEKLIKAARQAVEAAAEVSDA